MSVSLPHLHPALTLHLPVTVCPFCCPSIAKCTVLLHAQAAGALKESTRSKYLASLKSLSAYCDSHHLPWHTGSVMYWLGDLNLGTGKPLASSTLLQKISHVNLLVELQPPLIAGPQLSGSRLAPGLACTSLASLRKSILPPSFLLTLANLEKPQLLEAAIQFQALTGLRAGQMTILMPAHLATEGKLMIVPFKHQTLPQVVDIHHVPRWLVLLLLSFKKSMFTPILPWTPAQYQLLFSRLTSAYKLKLSTHSARHTFASVMKFLAVPLSVIATSMTHKQAKTLTPYLHALSPDEQQVVLAHPQYFTPISFSAC